MEPRRIVLLALLASVAVIVAVAITAQLPFADQELDRRLVYAWFVLSLYQAAVTAFVLPYTIYQMASPRKDRKKQRARRHRMRRT